MRSRWFSLKYMNQHSDQSDLHHSAPSVAERIEQPINSSSDSSLILPSAMSHPPITHIILHRFIRLPQINVLHVRRRTRRHRRLLRHQAAVAAQTHTENLEQTKRRNNPLDQLDGTDW